jgi:1,4-alpha-glucan branching enzyme
MKKYLSSAILILLWTCVHAQVLSWSPAFPKDNDEVVITFDASKGNRGLISYTGDVYIHTGVITSASANNGDWKNVVTVWNSNNPAHRMTPIGGNKYTYTITNPRAFYGLTGSETINRLAMVFRGYTATGNPPEGKTSDLSVDNGNMYVPVYPASTVGIRIHQPEFEARFQPFYLPITLGVGASLPVEARSSKLANLTLKLNGTTFRTATNDSLITGNVTLSSTGNQVLVAEINDNGNIKGDTVRFFIAPPSNIAPLPAGTKDGINYLAGDTAAILVLRAPGKTRVNVIGDFNNWTESAAFQMNSTPDGRFFWLRVGGLTPGQEYGYQYLVDGSLRVPDPYAELLLDPANDPFITAATYPGLKPYPTGRTTGIVGVLQPRSPAYNWQVPNFNRPDKKGLVVYELLVRDFIAAHDFKTLRDTISYFKRLGINAIELMPINEFEGNLSWGYNSSFYFAVDKYYGPRNTLKAFIDECHKNGIAVLLDIALNHQFGQSPMVQLYWDGANNRPAANSPWFNPVARHPFNVGFDMNHESQDTKYFFLRVAEYWLKEFKIDGFRYDLSKGFTQRNSCTTTNCDSGPEVGNWSAYDASRVAIWKQYYDSIQKYDAGSYVMLEHLGDNTEERELSDYGMLFWGNMNYNFTEAAMGFVGNSNFSGALSVQRGWNNPHLVSYAESHDEERMMYRTKQSGNAGTGHNTKDPAVALKRAELSAAFLMMMPGPKLIWQFGELGYDFSINYCISNGTVNNACRTGEKPIRWDYRNEPNRAVLYQAYSSFNALRFHPLYARAFLSNQVTYSLNGAMKWMRITTDTSSMVIVGNFDVSAGAIVVTFPTAGNWFNYMTGENLTATGSAQAIALQPGEYKIFVNRGITVQNPTTVPTVPVVDRLQTKLYPNPLTGSSVFTYHLPKTARVEISVHSASGQKIKNLFSGQQAKGQYQLNVSSLQSLSKGLYWIECQAGSERAIQKIVVQ